MRTTVIVLLLVSAACSDDEPPSYTHAEPDETASQTCVLCHSCGGDGTGTTAAPSPGRTHAVCRDCHATDPVQHNCDVTCDWQKDCDVNPPWANCDQCHASGVPKKTIAQVNDACRACHQHGGAG